MKQIHRTKVEREYIRAIIHNLSLNRFSDSEIVEYLNMEKQIQIARNTVAVIRNNIERSAEKWYVDLRQSTYRYIATYKTRIDALLSYQRKLHDIINTTPKDKIKIRAIAELTTIEMNIFSLWKQLPSLDIVEKIKQEEQEQQERDNYVPIVDEQDIDGYEKPPDNIESLAWTDWIQCDTRHRWLNGQRLLGAHKLQENLNQNQKLPPSRLETN